MTILACNLEVRCLAVELTHLGCSALHAELLCRCADSVGVLCDVGSVECVSKVEECLVTLGVSHSQCPVLTVVVSSSRCCSASSRHSHDVDNGHIVHVTSVGSNQAATILKLETHLECVGLSIGVDSNLCYAALELYTIVITISRVTHIAQARPLCRLLNLVSTCGEVILIWVAVEVETQGLVVVCEVLCLVSILVREHEVVVRAIL